MAKPEIDIKTPSGNVINVGLGANETEGIRLRDGMVYQHGYKDKITNEIQDDGTLIDPNSEEGAEIDNPQSKDDFMKDKIFENIKNAARAHEANKAADDARQAKIEEIDQITAS